MPFLGWKRKKVLCPLTNRLVSVENCYRCSYYIKRDLKFVFCAKELENLFGRYKIIKMNPFVVRAENGKIYKFMVDKNSRSFETSVFVEVKSGEIKAVSRPRR